ncbi:uncharacterized protein LOC142582118 [Dermacentor variabilis]|uniref:uncharacterized protein LOC142582118 n=1 Tax=Dermacentor variabilis TaxID=34621 RepID=UPI003F5AFB4C
MPPKCCFLLMQFASLFLGTVVPGAAFTRLAAPSPVQLHVAEIEEAAQVCTIADVCHGCGPSIRSSLPLDTALNVAIPDKPISNPLSSATSSGRGLKALCAVPLISGQLGNSYGMPPKCCFLLMQFASLFLGTVVPAAAFTRLAAPSPVQLHVAEIEEAAQVCTIADVCHGCGPSIRSSLPLDTALNVAIPDKPISNPLSSATSSGRGLKALCAVPLISGQLGNSYGMPPKCCFLLMQIRLPDTPGGRGGRSASPRIYRRSEDHFHGVNNNVCQIHIAICTTERSLRKVKKRLQQAASIAEAYIIDCGLKCAPPSQGFDGQSEHKGQVSNTHLSGGPTREVEELQILGLFSHHILRPDSILPNAED